MKAAGLKKAELEAAQGSGVRKALLAELLWRRTVVSQGHFTTISSPLHQGFTPLSKMSADANTPHPHAGVWPLDHTDNNAHPYVSNFFHQPPAFENQRFLLQFLRHEPRLNKTTIAKNTSLPLN